MTLPSDALLRAALGAAVPLWIDEIRSEAWPRDRIQAEAHACAQQIAEKGDVLQFGGGRKGAAAEAFNALACGLACLAHLPGGVKFLGNHWQVDVPEQGATLRRESNADAT